jgi:SAM-dependent methyltransferase
MISYGHIDDAYNEYYEFLCSLIRSTRPTRVIEIGGGATPAIPLDKLQELGITEYAVLDISAEELAKAPDGYSKVLCDICGDDIPTGYDLAISRFLAEHVPDARKFHQNVFKLLNPTGRAFHFFPTMFCSAYAANVALRVSRLEWIGEKMLTVIDPNRRRNGNAAKFPAYYRWCFGPTQWNVRRFQSVGYDIDQYRGFFGYYYYSKFGPLGKLHQKKTDWLLRNPYPLFTSLAYLVLTKP